jgi:hypothetical protein
MPDVRKVWMVVVERPAGWRGQPGKGAGDQASERRDSRIREIRGIREIRVYIDLH